MLTQLSNSLKRTTNQIVSDFKPAPPEHIVTYETVILQYYWQCYKILQLYRFIKSNCTNWDEKYFEQLKLSCKLAKYYSDEIDKATNISSINRMRLQMCSLHERVSGEIASANSNHFFPARIDEVRIQMQQRPIAIDNSSAPWYEKIRDNAYALMYAPGPDDGIGVAPPRNSFSINGRAYHPVTITDDEKRTYAYAIFMCWFYRVQLIDLRFRNANNSSECIRRIEKYLSQALSMEVLFEKRCNIDEFNLLVVRYFDLANIGVDNNIFYTKFIENDLVEQQKALNSNAMLFVDNTQTFFNVETLKDIYLNPEYVAARQPVLAAGSVSISFSDKCD